MTNMSDRLPYDILYNIFPYYQQGEDDFHPLETLLLVCKFWASVALDDRALWGRFRIRVGHEIAMKMWKTRLPLRLIRSGDTAPIEIDISPDMEDEYDPLNNLKFYSSACLGAEGNGRSFWSCHCNQGHEAYIIWLLDQLVGIDGKGRRRWTEFQFHTKMRWFTDHGPSSAARHIFRTLSGPTDSLVSISLRKIGVSRDTDKDLTLLPFAPALRNVRFKECNLPNISPLENATRIEVYMTAHYTTNLIDLYGAKSVQDLLIGDQQIALPTEVPFLRKLTLAGRYYPSNLDQVTIPHLTHLSLGFVNIDLYRQLSTCTSFSFRQLEELEISPRWSNFILHRDHKLMESTNLIFGCTTRLSTIVATSSFFSILLKWLWECKRGDRVSGGSRPWVWETKPVLISSSVGALGEFSGEESTSELESLALKWGLFSPDVSWGTLLNTLNHG